MIELAIVLGLALLGKRPKTGQTTRDGRDGRDGRDAVVTPDRGTLAVSRPRVDFVARRYAELSARASSGAKWLKDLKTYAPPGTTEIDTWAACITRFIGIESGGKQNALTVSTKIGREIGLTQVAEKYADKWTTAQLRAYGSASTPVPEVMSLLYKHIRELDQGATPGWNAQQRMWRLYMLHAVPVVYKSLVKQGFVVGGPQPGGNMDRAWQDWDGTLYKNFATVPGTAGTSKGVLVRIVLAADTVAGYHRDWSTVPSPTGVV